ncbi:S-adenosylmethionine-dependent methyltransferase [Arthroderma uncinatum]|uniref:S-adenosylmethionine-dependent methyltransferase n=1 Tax=Arthroderma uncinatum TaxID=74035 RepID=UPI00144A94CB|nr:S-adenosylmethionine-dependent methyltransferase [Arthroderma uncinatum]KAF3483512.1 S-adenosylmethionine-dependent methyltransferase [Arthroderma uncinatum]
MPNLSVVGVDISPIAVSLAKKNLEHNIQSQNLLPRARDEVQFVQADILSPHSMSPDGSELGRLLDSLQSRPPVKGQSQGWDLLISNPPYISPYEFANGTTKRSVRLYEPTLALVPPIRPAGLSQTVAPSDLVRADTFYPRLLAISAQLGARFTVLECGDVAQAQRVAALTGDPSPSPSPGSERNTRTEIWRCDWDSYAHRASPNSNEQQPELTDATEEDRNCDDQPRIPAEQGARAVVISRY